jgi:hypothetical protein
MKKLRLKALSLGATEILSREQLKSITGGCTSALNCDFGQYCDSYEDPITHQWVDGVCITADTGGSGSGEPHGSSPDCGSVSDGNGGYTAGCPHFDAFGVFIACQACN